MEQATLNILIPVVAALIALGSGLLTFHLNECSKRRYEEYKRREERYASLIRSLKGFYETSPSEEKKTEFLDQVSLCWMYCPDDVINRAYRFLSTVRTGQKYSKKDQEKAVGELILEIRRDLIGRKPLRKTVLRPEQFQILVPIEATYSMHPSK